MSALHFGYVPELSGKYGFHIIIICRLGIFPVWGYCGDLKISGGDEYDEEVDEIIEVLSILREKLSERGGFEDWLRVPPRLVPKMCK